MIIDKKEECDIMTDLLPLYVENLTQEDTEQWIKEHLSGCEQCRKNYELMQASFTEMIKEEKKVKKKKTKLFKKVKLRLFLYGYVLVLAVIWLYCMWDFIFGF